MTFKLVGGHLVYTYDLCFTATVYDSPLITCSSFAGAVEFSTPLVDWLENGGLETLKILRDGVRADKIDKHSPEKHVCDDDGRPRPLHPNNMTASEYVQHFHDRGRWRDTPCLKKR